MYEANIVFTCSERGWAIAEMKDKTSVFLRIARAAEYGLQGTELVVRATTKATMPTVGEQICFHDLLPAENGGTRMQAGRWMTLAHYKTMQKAASKAAETLAKLANDRLTEERKKADLESRLLRRHGRVSSKTGKKERKNGKLVRA